MRIPVVALLALLMLCAVPSKSEATHAYNNIHWRATGGWPHTITLYNSLSDSAPSGSPLGDARSDWNAGQNRITWATATAGSNSADTREACADPSGANGLRVCDYNWGATGWLGRATWKGCDSAATGHICGGGVRVNRYYGTTYAFYRQVLCHELGHYLGLEHRSSGSSCLRTKVQIEPQYTSPDGHDFNQVEAQHDHRHAAPSLSATKDFVFGRVRLSWTGLSTDYQYRIYRSVEGGPYQSLAYTRSTSYDDRPPATSVGDTYCYRVMAQAEGGWSPYSNGRCVVWSADDLTTPTAPPEPPDTGDDVTDDGPPAL